MLFIRQHQGEIAFFHGALVALFIHEGSFPFDDVVEMFGNVRVVRRVAARHDREHAERKDRRAIRLGNGKLLPDVLRALHRHPCFFQVVEAFDYHISLQI